VHSPVRGPGDPEAEPDDTLLGGAGNNRSLVGVAIVISNVLLCFCCAVVWRLIRRRQSLGDEFSDTSRSAFGMLPGFGRTSDKKKKQSADNGVVAEITEEEADEPPAAALYRFEQDEVLDEGPRQGVQDNVSTQVLNEGLDMWV